jgi:hypothetical protein
MWGEGTGGCEVTCGCLVYGSFIGGRERYLGKGTGSYEVTYECWVCGKVIGRGERDMWVEKGLVYVK